MTSGQRHLEHASPPVSVSTRNSWRVTEARRRARHDGQTCIRERIQAQRQSVVCLDMASCCIRERLPGRRPIWIMEWKRSTSAPCLDRDSECASIL